MSFDIENRLFVYDEEKWKDLFSKNYKREAPSVVEVDNGIVLPLRKYKDYNMMVEGGVCDRKFKFVAGHYLNYPDPNGYLCCSRSYKPSEPVQVRHETVIFGGILYGGFWLTISSNLSRLWYLADHPKTPYKFVFLKNTFWGNLTINMLEIAGLSEDKIEIIEHPTQFDKIIVPEQTFYIFSSHRVGAEKIYNYIRERVKPGAYKKVYLSRSALPIGGNNEITFNEQYFENFYQKRGYEIIHPEQLPFKEQLSIMAGADEIIAWEGTLLFLTQFCKPETKVVILRRTVGHTPITPLLTTSIIPNCKIIDVHFNFLPATLDMGAELVGPTSCWRRYLEHEGIPHTSDEVSEDLHIRPILYDYVKLWGKIADAPSYFARDTLLPLNNYTLIDILDYVNSIFRGNKIDRSLYSDRNDVLHLTDENNKLREIFTLALSDYIKNRYESLKSFAENEKINSLMCIDDKQVKHLKQLSRLEKQLQKKKAFADTVEDEQTGHE
ncbi:glycosyltransferase family 61 protein [uncultured Mailhella sp.]|uniref:glycosyltransferase 61 family protein n=1 Tax=uncultured Mailhella sp. TaxID=1981031 RepID=UPI0026393551|nr:glycosyltransferase family 61 protein [uncultured Mailhella sp.]